MFSNEKDNINSTNATNMQVDTFSIENNDLAFETNTVELITDYETYSAYQFNLDYTESFFENNNLLVFIVQSCSSDR